MLKIGKKYVLLKIALGVCLLVSQVTAAMAQNNPYRINDKLYPYFVKINSMLRSEASLRMADTLFQRASSLHDVKAQCLALSMKNFHYYYQSNLDMMIKSMKKEQEFAIKTPYKQYVFDPWNHLITYYANVSRMYDALREAKEYQREAIRLNNSYGISQSYRKLGDLYIAIGNYQEALKQFDIAARLKKELGDERNISDIYYGMANCYCTLSLYKQAKCYFLMVYNDEKKRGLPVTAVGLYRVYVNEGTHLDSIEYFKHLADEEFDRGKMNRSNNNIYVGANARYYLLKKDYKKALEWADKLVANMDAVKEEIYREMGDYKNAYYYLRNYNIVESQRRNDVSREMMVRLTADMNQANLEREKQLLELNNTRLQLQQSKAHERLMLLENNQTTLELKNKQLAIEQQQSQIEKSNLQTKQAMLLADNEKAQMTNQRDKAILLEQQSVDKMKILFLICFLLFAVTVLSLIFLYHRHHQNKKLIKEKQLADEAFALADQERKKAKEADRLKSLFLQNMSHEIRTPLNAIVGFNEVLNSDLSSDMPMKDKEEMTKLIRTNSDLLITLVNDILDLSKFESGLYKLSLNDANVSEVCHIVVNSVKARVADGVQMILDVPDDEIVINTDGQRLQQLLINLLTNACKYTTNGRIVLSCHRKLQSSNADLMPGKSVVEFAVTDTGVGIPKDKSNAVFDRFEKLDNFKQGTGLGLSICKQIATLLGGEIFVDVNYTQGARFVFLHPIL